MPRRAFLAAAGMGLVALTGRSRLAEAAVVKTRPEVRIGVGPLEEYALAGPLIVAASRGLFEAHGVRAETTSFRSHDEVVDQIATGGVLLGLVSGAAALLGHERHDAVVIVATHTEGNPLAVSVRDHSSAATVPRPCRLGVPEGDPGARAVAELWVRRAGCEPEAGARIIPRTGLGALVRSLEEGEIDAFVAGDGRAVSEVQGRTRMLPQSRNVGRSWVGHVVCARAASVQHDRDAIRGALRALFHAVRFTKAHLQESAHLVAERFEWTMQTVLRAHAHSGGLLSVDGHISTEALAAMQGALLELGMLTAAAPLGTLYSRRFVPVRF